jgi:hypothetical protein
MKGRECARDGEFAGLCVGAPGAFLAGSPVSGVGVPAGIHNSCSRRRVYKVLLTQVPHILEYNPHLFSHF